VKKRVYKAISEAYDKKKGDMLRLAASMLRMSIEDAEDAVHTAFAELLGNAGKYPSLTVEEAIRLFYGYTINICKRVKQKSAEALESQDAFEDIEKIAAGGASVEDLAISGANYREIVGYLENTLHAVDFSIFVMKYSEGMKHKEIAAAIGGGASERLIGHRVEHIKLKIIKHIGGKNGQ